MKHQNTLCAVDVDRAGTLAEPSLEAAMQAIRLLQGRQSRLRFVHVLDVPEKSRKEMLGSDSGPAWLHYKNVQSVLSSLCAKAGKKGITADHEVLFGKPWLTLVKEVLRAGHDLVLLGTARPVSFLKAVFGGTSLKMIRKCPCPVWVTKPPKEEIKAEILVAHCLTEVGTQALAWGAALAQNQGAKLKVLHIVELEHRAFEQPWSSGQLQRQVADVKSRLQDELREVAPDSDIDVEFLVEVGTPSAVIHQYLNSNEPDLLVMGTVARSGIAGIITGNTAETLLPWVPCSLLALKPKEFQTPVTVAT
jgi:universal stress protein E